MNRLLVALCFLALNTFEALAVIGGNPAPDLARHTVMVLSKKGAICSGAILSQNTVLTAAHCVHDGSEYAIHYRTQSGEPVLLSPNKIITHPDYVPDAITKRIRSIDLAILQVNEPLPAIFQPVELSKELMRANEIALIGGYGLTNEKNRSSNGQFFSTPLKVIEPYGPSKILIWLKGDPIPPGNLNRGGCHGDSGGPIFSGNKLVAITTWTTGPKGFDCGDLTQGALVAPQINWITKNIR